LKKPCPGKKFQLRILLKAGQPQGEKRGGGPKIKIKTKWGTGGAVPKFEGCRTTVKNRKGYLSGKKKKSCEKGKTSPNFGP